VVTLVTGCRSGFGLLTAVAAGRAGHTVYAGLRDLSTAGALREACQGLDVHPVQLDVTDPAQREAVIADIEARHGALDALVNNAGIMIGGAVEEFSEEELRRLFEVNLFGLWALTRRTLPAMRGRGQGIIVNVSSMAGRAGAPSMGMYAASKHALNGMSEAMRLELYPHGVRVTLVEPGPYRTDIFSRNLQVCAAAQAADSPYREMLDATEAIAEAVHRRAGDPQEVADRIVALIADPNPPLWNPMGPSTWPRRLLRWLLPGRGYEALIRWLVYRNTTS